MQEAGSYRLARRDDEARFGYAVGPHSWKQFLFPPRIRLWQARRRNGGFEIEEEPTEDTPLAFFGVRSCELHAIAIQDRVFLEGRHVDRDYAARREDAFVVAVNCFEPGGTCFCVSMGTGPRAESGYDLALTEILDGEHRLLVEAGSERGAELLAELPHRPADGCGRSTRPRWPSTARPGRWVASSTRPICATCSHGNLEHPRWDEVAERCLTCGNCTMVCPTCFCSSIEDDDRPGRRRGGALTRLGHLLLGRPLATSTAAASGRRPLPLPPVADAQVRHLARPVRQLRLRRLRPVHHLVPSRDRRHRGGCAAIRATRRRSDARRRLSDLLARAPALRRASPASSSRCSPAAARTSASLDGEALFREGDPADTLLRRPPRPRRARDVRSRRAAPVTIETIEAGRGRRLVVALPAVPLALRRARARRSSARSPSTAPACAGSATPTTSSATS